MRDIIITAIVFGAIPWILRQPWTGMLMWSWLSYMNPHRMTWGFAYNMPFNAVTAVALFAGMLLSSEKKRFPVSPITVVWILFVIWLVVTTVFAIYPHVAFEALKRDFKVQLFALLTLVLMTRRERIDLLIWVIVVSIGFFGVKGGLFTILTAGHYRVWGPPDSFIEGNNELALALLMIVPLMRYLQLQSANKWIRRGLGGAMVLCILSILASYSRGALVAGFIVLLYFWFKSRHRLALTVAIAVLVIGIVPFIPHQWTSRMDTIETYHKDASAMGRINAWHFAINLAKDRPLMGGGFGAFTSQLFQLYAPNPNDVHDAHSIYFQMLGEHGYVGLFLFLLLIAMSFGIGRKVARKARGNDQLVWARDLAAMLQVSMVAYLTGGAFLGLGYFDLPYHIIALMILVNLVIDRDAEEAGQMHQQEHAWRQDMHGHFGDAGNVRS